ncbi:ribonuclease H-like domain-containing protein [Cohnella cellulosilytica]|uniref:Ribonuclease H-like domain-containing protein n=1 Tax=Cohnella cellulosilytica TaxID=986710 RepID=A0ABW2F1L1_9BACL
MSGLRDRLNRLRGAPEAAPPRSEPPAPAETERPALPAGFAAIDVGLEENEAGPFLLRRIAYPLPYRHGRHELGELLARAGSLQPIAARQNGGSGPIEPGRLLFLDTETTGLGVGAGNVPFMVGFGYYEGGAFIVEQTLIRHPGEERAMLTYLLGRLQDKTHVVSYNGRTFDWPVLANRFILNGWRSSGPGPGHLDFLHPSRALWRNTLPSCRLSAVEEGRLGIRREEDVPGSLAPALYFQYLSDGNPEHLHGVYAHNEKDILTLASLAVHFGRLLDGDGDEEATLGSEELFRTAGWLEQHGLSEVAERLFERLAEREEAGEAGWSLPLAARYKKIGRYERALPLWRRFAEAANNVSAPRVEAHIELAMHYEHRDKQLLTALTYAEKALELAVRRGVLARDKAKRDAERAALQHRIARLRDKVSRERKSAKP